MSCHYFLLMSCFKCFVNLCLYVNCIDVGLLLNAKKRTFHRRRNYYKDFMILSDKVHPQCECGLIFIMFIAVPQHVCLRCVG